MIETDDPSRRSYRVSTIALGLLLVLVGANSTFNVAASWLGYGLPYTTFLPPPGDAFADYFKFVLSYPGGATIRFGNLLGLHDLIRQYQTANPYHGVEALTGTSLTRLHVTPLTTCFSLLNLKAMTAVDPVALFIGLNLALLCHWCAIVSQFARSRREALVWVAVAVVAYPTLMMVARGNLFAGVTAVCVAHAMLLALRERSLPTSAMVLAIAIGLRPNAVVFVVPFLALTAERRWRTLAMVVAWGMATTCAALLCAHLWYPEYTPTTFLAGLARYYQLYVVGNDGLAFGSSLYGGMKLLFGYRPGLATAAGLVALSVLAVAVRLRTMRGLRDSTLIFLVCAAYCLGSTVFADYHLIVFVLVPMTIAAESREREIDAQDWIAMTASCLILAPKNYLYVDGVSWQVVVNPLILLAAVCAIVRSNGMPPTGPEVDEGMFGGTKRPLARRPRSTAAIKKLDAMIRRVPTVRSRAFLLIRNAARCSARSGDTTPALRGCRRCSRGSAGHGASARRPALPRVEHLGDRP